MAVRLSCPVEFVSPLRSEVPSTSTCTPGSAVPWVFVTVIAIPERAWAGAGRRTAGAGAGVAGRGVAGAGACAAGLGAGAGAGACANVTEDARTEMMIAAGHLISRV